jgi:hypothetical protein
MELSKQAIKELRIALINSYGKELNDSLNDVEVNEIGELLLTILAEGLKTRIAKEKSTR